MRATPVWGSPFCLSVLSGSVRRVRLRLVRPVEFPGLACAARFCSSGPVPPGSSRGGPVRLARSGSACARLSPAQPGAVPTQSGPILPDPAQSGSARPSPAQPGPIRPSLIQPDSARLSTTQPDSARLSPALPGYVPACMAGPGCGGRPGQRNRPLPDGRVGWGCNEKADLPKGKSALFRFPKALTRSAE